MSPYPLSAAVCGYSGDQSRPDKPVWPPTEEHAVFLPALGINAGVTPIAVQLSPMCYPMHDHSEPTQTAQGGNYNNGLLSGINFTGDQNALGGADGTSRRPRNLPERTGY